MVQQEGGPEKQTQEQASLAGKKVSDHLANERTFLAWLRTGLATITFGFVVERFGLLLRELGVKGSVFVSTPVHYSTIIGVALTILGVVMMITALFDFFHVSHAIDKGTFRPSFGFIILITTLACCIGVLLALYLLISGPV